MRERRLIALVAALIVLAVGGCTETEHPTLAIEAEAEVIGLLFLDLNGNGQLDLQSDSPMKGWQVRLLGSNRAVVATTTSDSAGAFQFDEVPTGQVRLEVDKARLGDSLEVFGAAVGNEISLGPNDTTVVTVGFTYPKVSVGAVDTLPVGRRVFVDGIALNAVTATGPREIHLRSGTDAVRVTNVVRRAVSPGDSVRVLARRGNEAGQPILTGGDIIPIRASVSDPEPIELSTRASVTAQQGAVASDLARIRNADLVRSRNELNDVILTVDDGSGPTEILIRAFLGADAAMFHPDSVRIREAIGLLIPYVDSAGTSKWRVATRSAVDLRTERQPRTPPAVARLRLPVAAAPQKRP